MDMRKIKSAGKLVYTTSTAWEVRKGGAFRGNERQMHDHCASIVASGKFSGAGFSSGDDYIAKCAARDTDDRASASFEKLRDLETEAGRGASDDGSHER